MNSIFSDNPVITPGSHVVACDVLLNKNQEIVQYFPNTMMVGIVYSLHSGYSLYSEKKEGAYTVHVKPYDAAARTTDTGFVSIYELDANGFRLWNGRCTQFLPLCVPLEYAGLTNVYSLAAATILTQEIAGDMGKVYEDMVKSACCEKQKKPWPHENPLLPYYRQAVLDGCSLAQRLRFKDEAPVEQIIQSIKGGTQNEA